jgi:hypothetical protein
MKQLANMRFALLFFVFTTFSSFAGAATKASAGEGVFYGVVQAVDLGAKTFTIKANGRSYLFHYNHETKISRRSGYVSWSTVKPGEGANVLMRVGEGNVGMAIQVRFTKDAGEAEDMALYVARLTDGETISGAAVNNFVVFEPPPISFAGAAGFGITSKYGSRSGVFHLAVRPDGSVAEVTAAKSLNDDKMNQRIAAWLRKWKFRPKSVTEVQIPVAFSWGT